MPSSPLYPTLDAPPVQSSEEQDTNTVHYPSLSITTYQSPGTSQTRPESTHDEKMITSLSGDGVGNGTDVEGEEEGGGEGHGSHAANSAELAAIRRAYRLSVFIMILVNFIDNINFAIVIPSLYPYVAKMGGSRSFYGWCISVYSLCQFIMAPLLGWLSNYRPYKEILAMCISLEVVASVIYALAPNRWGILLARILVGASSGAVAVTRSYISGATTPAERTKYMSYIMMAQVLGFVFGPALGAALSKIPVIVISRQEPRIVIDQYTIVGWISFSLGIVCICMIFLFLREPPNRSKRKRRSRRRRRVNFSVQESSTPVPATHQGSLQYDQYIAESPIVDPAIPASTFDEVDSDMDVTPSTPLPSPSSSSSSSSLRHRKQIVRDDRPYGVRFISIISCLFIYFVSVNTFTVFETIATPLTELFYGFEVWHNGLLFVGASIVSIVGFIVVGLISRFVEDKVLLIVATAFMTVGFGILIDWTQYLPFWRFVIGAIVISLVLPMSQAIVNSLFSKMIEEKQQGVMMGYMTSASSMARILGPLYSTFIFDQIGAYALFGVVTCLTAFTTIYQLVAYRYMKLHPEQQMKLDEELHKSKQMAKEKKLQKEVKYDDNDEKRHLLNGGSVQEKYT